MPEPIKEDKAIAALYAAYRRKFKEDPPSFGLPPGDPLKRIREALKTGKPILEEIPPGSEA
jgi:hypothetical protein